MEINGFDLGQLAPQMPARVFPATVPGRTVHIDADFLAYQSSYEKDGEDKSLADMQHNCSVAVETMRKLAAAQYVHLHLTPGTSDKGGRHKVAIQREYQGNRKDRPKPRYLHMMREWMSKNFPATMHQFCEADDGMSSAQYKDASKSIICSKDKDLDMVPGLHLDWDTGEIKETVGDYGEIWLDSSKSSTKLKGLGQKFFWAQMLMGDTADNIQGLPVLMTEHMTKPKKVGPSIAYSLLTGVNSNKDAFQYVKGLYESTGHYVGYKNYRDGTTVPWQHVFMSEMKLLWMRRDKDNKDDVLLWLKSIIN